MTPALHTETELKVWNQLVIGVLTSGEQFLEEQKGPFVLVDPKDSWVHALLQVCFSRRKFLSTLEHGFECLRPTPQNLVISVGSMEMNRWVH